MRSVRVKKCEVYDMLQIPAELNGYKLRASCSFEGGSGVIFGYKANSACRSGFSFVVASVNADCLKLGQWIQGHYFVDEGPALDCYFELAGERALKRPGTRSPTALRAQTKVMRKAFRSDPVSVNERLANFDASITGEEGDRP